MGSELVRKVFLFGHLIVSRPCKHVYCILCVWKLVCHQKLYRKYIQGVTLYLKTLEEIYARCLLILKNFTGNISRSYLIGKEDQGCAEESAQVLCKYKVTKLDKLEWLLPGKKTLFECKTQNTQMSVLENYVSPFSNQTCPQQQEQCWRKVNTCSE